MALMSTRSLPILSRSFKGLHSMSKKTPPNFGVELVSTYGILRSLLLGSHSVFPWCPKNRQLSHQSAFPLLSALEISLLFLRLFVHGHVPSLTAGILRTKSWVVEEFRCPRNFDTKSKINILPARQLHVWRSFLTYSFSHHDPTWLAYWFRGPLLLGPNAKCEISCLTLVWWKQTSFAVSRRLFSQWLPDASLPSSLPADDSERFLRSSLPGWSAQSGFFAVSKPRFPVLWFRSQGGVRYPDLVLDIANTLVYYVEYDWSTLIWGPVRSGLRFTGGADVHPWGFPPSFYTWRLTGSSATSHIDPTDRTWGKQYFKAVMTQNGFK